MQREGQAGHPHGQRVQTDTALRAPGRELRPRADERGERISNSGFPWRALRAAKNRRPCSDPQAEPLRRIETRTAAGRGFRARRSTMRNPLPTSTAPRRLRALGYVRVSTNQQAQEVVSLEAQQTRTRAHCISPKIELVDVILDDGEWTRRMGPQQAPPQQVLKPAASKAGAAADLRFSTPRRKMESASAGAPAVQQGRVEGLRSEICKHLLSRTSGEPGSGCVARVGRHSGCGRRAIARGA